MYKLHGFEHYTIEEFFRITRPDLQPEFYEQTFTRAINEVLRGATAERTRQYYTQILNTREFAVESHAELFDIEEDFSTAEAQLLPAGHL